MNLVSTVLAICRAKSGFKKTTNSKEILCFRIEFGLKNWGYGIYRLLFICSETLTNTEGCLYRVLREIIYLWKHANLRKENQQILLPKQS